MTCCGAPAEWAGEVDIHAAHLEEMRRQWRELGEPTVVLACPNCRKMFEEYLPELPVVFLAEVMEEWGVETAGTAGEPYALFDPCASRYYPELQESVRHLADAAGITWENLPYDGKKARCCGYGGHIGIASPSHTSYMTTSRAKEEELPYVTYCVNCRESFAGQGKEAVHILDLLFGLNGAGARRRR